MPPKIKVSMAPGEQDREQCMRSVLSHDTRFEPLQIDSAIPVDLKFVLQDTFTEDCSGILTPNVVGYHRPRTYKIGSEKSLNMELKRPIDFVQSVLSGHLMDQTLSIRESMQDGCTVILGDLGDIQAAIKDASKLRAGKYLRGAELGQAISSTHLRCKSFRKRSFLNGVPVFYIGDDSGFFDNVKDDEDGNKIGVWQDILELASDYLTDGDMLGFRMRPAENEREVAAASMLTRGIGPETWRNILAEYQLQLLPRKDPAKPIEEIDGIGKKRAAMLNKLVRMVYR